MARESGKCLLLQSNPKVTTVQVWGCSRARTFSGLPGHPPKRRLLPSPLDLGAIRERAIQSLEEDFSEAQSLREWRPSKEVPKPRPVQMPKIVLRKVLALNGVPRKALKMCLRSPRLCCWKPLSLNFCQTVCTRAEHTSEPHPNHIRTTSEPHPSRIRNNDRNLREKWFLTACAIFYRGVVFFF